jgi:hypothetical protein
MDYFGSASADKPILNRIMLGITGSNKLCNTVNDLDEILIIKLPFSLVMPHYSNFSVKTLTKRFTSS